MMSPCAQLSPEEQAQPPEETWGGGVSPGQDTGGLQLLPRRVVINLSPQCTPFQQVLTEMNKSKWVGTLASVLGPLGTTTLARCLTGPREKKGFVSFGSIPLLREKGVGGVSPWGQVSGGRRRM